MVQETISLAAACRLLGICHRTGRLAVARGQLGVVQIGERLRVPRAEIDRIVRAGVGFDVPGAELRRVHVVAKGEGI